MPSPVAFASDTIFVAGLNKGARCAAYRAFIWRMTLKCMRPEMARYHGLIRHRLAPAATVVPPSNAIYVAV